MLLFMRLKRQWLDSTLYSYLMSSLFTILREKLKIIKYINISLLSIVSHSWLLCNCAARDCSEPYQCPALYSWERWFQYSIKHVKVKLRWPHALSGVVLRRDDEQRCWTLAHPEPSMCNMTQTHSAGERSPRPWTRPSILRKQLIKPVRQQLYLRSF